MIDEAQAPFPFPSRAADAHKGAVGTVLVVGGSRGMTGAAFLAGKGALRTGAGLVTIGCPEGANQVLEVKTTCVMTRPFPETEAGALAPAALEPLVDLARARSAVAIGPGLSRDPGTVELVHLLVERLGRTEGAPPVVLDADGLNAFAGDAERLQVLGGRCVLTPHPGELARLGEAGKERVRSEREAVTRELAARLGVVTLHKGKGTVVCDEAGERTYVNPTGNPGMASGGTGDVLTGVVAALLAAGLAPYEAACLGAWLHGKAGDAVARRVGQAPLIATDLLEGLCAVIRAEETRSGEPPR